MPGLDNITFDNSFSAELEGLYVTARGDVAPDPAVVCFNQPLADELGLGDAGLDSPQGAAFLTGSALPAGAAPLAQAYAGHQFGGFAPTLGDGRALLIGEVIDRYGKRRDIQLKGSGRTAFSRSGDGKAVLGPVLREHLIGEAMHALGIPTTRALASVTTGEMIMREGWQPGAVLARVAASHLRIGTFQFFAARRDTQRLRKLAGYAIRRHFPEFANSKDKYLELLRGVAGHQTALVAKWMAAGFVHGVMNTDNVTISGETLDYGPCAFMDAYDPGTVFNAIDVRGQYAYGNQPVIMVWNLSRFAEALLVLIDPDDVKNAIRLAAAEIDGAYDTYGDHWLVQMRAKLGLTGHAKADGGLVNSLFKLLEGQRVDFTGLFRCLAHAARGNEGPVRSLFASPEVISGWLEDWLARLAREKDNPAVRADAMDTVNPVYIARNHKVEEALQAAVRQGDFAPFKKLLEVLERPFEQRAGLEDYEGPAPENFGRYTTHCGT